MISTTTSTHKHRRSNQSLTSQVFGRNSQHAFLKIPFNGPSTHRIAPWHLPNDSGFPAETEHLYVPRCTVQQNLDFRHGNVDRYFNPSYLSYIIWTAVFGAREQTKAPRIGWQALLIVGCNKSTLHNKRSCPCSKIVGTKFVVVMFLFTYQPCKFEDMFSINNTWSRNAVIFRR